MTSLTHNESIAINKFASTYAKVQQQTSDLAESKKELAKQRNQVTAILEAKGKRLPTTTLKQRHHIVLATTNSQITWTQSLTERFPVSDNNLKELIRSDFPDCHKIGVSNTVKASTLR
jgi:RIO-like serine/threonine protein kinase